MSGGRAPRASEAAPPVRPARVEAVASLLRAAPRGADTEAAERHADAVAEVLLPVIEDALLRGPQAAGPGPAAPSSAARERATAGGLDRGPAPPAGRPATPEAALGTATPGEPLAPALREAAGHALGVDLEPVRLHRGAAAAGTAAALGARAYAFGAHVVLGPDWGGTGTASGRRLLAHELAHVAVQAHQGEARVQHDLHGASQQRAPFDPIDTGADPAAFIAVLPTLFTGLRSVVLDAEAVARGVSPKVLQPSECFLFVENYIVVVRPDGSVRDLFEQDTSHPTMLDAPVVFLREHRTGLVWFLGLRGDHLAIQSFRRYTGVPEPGRRAGDSVLVAYMPGVLVPPELARSLSRRARGASGTEAEAPGWARDAAARQRRRRSGGAGATAGGPGAGARGEGAGGGGAADRSTGTGSEGTGPGTDPGTASGAGPGAAAQGAGAPPRAPGVLRGPAVYRAGVSRTGTPQLAITIDRATTTIPLREGESPAALDRRVDAAERALQESRDPSARQSIADGARTTGFTPPPAGSAAAVVPPQEARAQARASGAATTPGERVPGGRTGANAPAYPSQITMAGIEPEEPAISTAGATNRFTMALDYAARSLGFQDEVFNRMQTVQFYWEIIDVTGLTREQARSRSRTTAVGGGEAQTGLSALGTNLSRDAAAVAEDQQRDLEMMSEEDWPWQARASYLMVIGLSNTVRLLGSVIGSFIDAVTQPLNERSIGFDREGDFLVRCVATPQWSDEAAADPEHHVLRASSIAVKPVRISSLGTRAAEGADREATSLAAARAELAAALASGDPRRIAVARANLERLVAAGRAGGFETYTQTLGALRRRLTTAQQLRTHRAQRAPISELSDDEVLLDIQLLRTGQSVEDCVAVTQRQLTQFAGENDEHATWVGQQHARFTPVGGITEFRPRLALASEENGQVTEVRTMLGELAGSREGARRWALVDITSPGSRDIYVGRGSPSGHAGQVAAIRDAFRVFAENSGYGRGTLAIRLPAELGTALGAPVPIEPAMRSAPGSRARAMQRLRDLATVAEIAAIFATGGLGVAIGAVGGIAGAITAIDALARRARTGHTWEIGLVFDVLGVVGGVASTLGVGTFVARGVAESGRAAGRLPSWINRLERTETALHIHGVVGNVQQLITIPVQLAVEWNEIDRAEGLTEGERDSRRARAFLGALRSGAITVVSMGGGLAHHEEGARPRTGGEEPPLPAGTGAPEAQALADGSGPPRPPVRDVGGPRAEGGAEAAGTTPVAGERAAAGAEGPVGPAVTDLVAQARSLAERRLAAARRAASEGGAERATAEPARPQEETVEARTAAGTTRPTRPGDPAAPDVNTAERDLAVQILGVRLGQTRPPGPVDPAAPPPRPGPFGSRTTSAEQAVATYDQAVAAGRGAEVGLFFNPNTGEFAVQIGTEFSVRSPAGDGWQALVHLHPNPENIIVLRMPAPADIALAVRAALRSGSHTEFVQSTRPDGSTGITRVTVTTNPMRIVVEIPAAPGEPARRIDVPTPEAYSREYGSETRHLDPASPAYEWVMRDLDDFYRQRREDDWTGSGTAVPGDPAARQPGEHTAMGTAPPERVPSPAEAEATAEIARLRARLYRWRSTSGGDPAAASLIDTHLAALRDLAAAARRGENVEGALHGIREDLPAQRRLTRPVDAGRVTALAARARRAAARTRDPEAAAELTRIAGEADLLAARTAAEPGYDARTGYDVLDRQTRRATRREYEVYIDLLQPAERAQVTSWFEDHLAPLHSTPVGVLLVRDIIRHIETADALTLTQSPRSAGIDVAGTAAMQRQVREGIAAGRYSAEYTALFEAAARDAAAQGFTDGWPRTPDGVAWQVDHVGELWLGGADDASNYLALPPVVHSLKTAILGQFRREFRGRSIEGESRDLRETDAPEP
ncbi:DUF4157 domain-containing protein [Streptomyces coeruleoprunus]|uniref:DUF4157 domain-containing protein n=1 Tax=Streptomyces coeruleoprunus TaxID=285563 RepID=A0ABV9XAQ5_9ACTN